ncbi:PREDICTED: trichohyalin-like [Acropora digitifera]|uniref:trichohyalin-like n=1 Tax=Acropora digitifera TaxID=70779 RepID=UPI00077AF35D|nr:PREDICTED: trichohyalin-like [Acropora digitifera]
MPVDNAGSSPRGPTVSEADVQMQRELVRQQQEFLHQQQEQLAKSQNQQALALKQQEQLCEQIRQLEEQQKQLQSSVSLLSPAGEDLAEIKQQEQQIVNLLSEQQRQDNELQRLHLLQQQRLEEQSNSFTHERKALEQHQELLQLKIKEQDARSRQLERELEEMARKHADAEAEWTRKISSVKAETTEAISRRYEKDKNHRKDEERVERRSIDPEKLGKRKKRALSADYFAEHSDVDKSQHEPRRRRSIELHYDETEGRNRRTTRRSSSPDINMEESLRHKARSPGFHFHEGKSRNSRTRSRVSIDEGEAEDSLRNAKDEGSKRGQVRGRKSDHVDKEDNFTAQSHPERSRRSKSEKKTRKTRDRSIETEWNSFKR